MTAIEGLMVVFNDIKTIVDFIFSFMNIENYRSLLLVLLAGEITLITLFFTLIPIVLEKRESELYLGIKINDFFLFKSSEKGELLNTWIRSVLILICNILLCFFDCIALGYICSFTFYGFMIRKICYFLGYISNNDNTIESIKTNAEGELENEPNSVIERMVETSKEDWKAIHDNIQFLERQKEGVELIGDYINRLFEENTEHKSKIFDEVSRLIAKNDHCYDLYLDSYEVYRFFRNSLGDFNKEDHYLNMYTLIVNDFNLCIKNKDRKGNFATMFVQAVESSEMSEMNKRMVKDRIINNTRGFLYSHKKQEIGSVEYYNKYSYYFDFVKYFIDEGDLVSFEHFLRANGSFYDDETFLIDIYTTCMIYFYYLLEEESEYYVSVEKKAIVQKMKEKLVERFDFDTIALKPYFYEKYRPFTENLRKVSSWWDVMDMEEAKICVVQPMIETIIKCLFLLFERDYVYGKYKFSNEIVDAFKFDIKWGKVAQKTKFDRFFEFMDYSFSEADYEDFEIQYAAYIVDVYKTKELAGEIDNKFLESKLVNNKGVLEKQIRESNIFNGKACSDIKEAKFAMQITKSALESYYEERSVLPIDAIKTGVEKSIYKCIIAKIKDKRYGGISKWRNIPHEISDIKGNYYYFRPISDQLGHIRDLKDLYSEAISKFTIIDTSVRSARLLVEDYSCYYDSLYVSLEDLDDTEIEAIKSEYQLEDDKYYKSNDTGVEIPYSSTELDNMIRRTYRKVVITVKFGLDVIGDKNIAFIQGEKPTEE